MHFLIMGAGAVGSVVAAHLAAAGHEVSFWVRPQQRRERARLQVQRVSSRASRPAPARELVAPMLSDGDQLPSSDWLLVCVRGEQLDAALRQIAAQLGPDRDVMISAVSVDNVLQRARRHGLRGRVLAHHVSFGAWRDPADPARSCWFPFRAPSIISAEGERASLPQARALAATLQRSGLSTIAARSVRGPMQYMMALSAPFLAAWDLCDYQLERLARDRGLRQLAARAMVEAPACLRMSGAAKLLSLLPAGLWSLVLRVLPRLIGPKGREVWLHHGPKIRLQTHYCLDLLLESRAPSPALRALAEQLRAAHPSSVYTRSQ